MNNSVWLLQSDCSSLAAPVWLLHSCLILFFPAIFFSVDSNKLLQLWCSFCSPVFSCLHKSLNLPQRNSIGREREETGKKKGNEGVKYRKNEKKERGNQENAGQVGLRGRKLGEKCGVCVWVVIIIHATISLVRVMQITAKHTKSWVEGDHVVFKYKKEF